MEKPFGIDVSHHQNPKALPWTRIAETSSFAIVRACYGTMADRVTKEHMARARAAGLSVGSYIFYRPSQAWDDQLAVFRAVVDGAGYGVGDIVPALDVESDPVPKPGTPVSKDWQHGVRALLEALTDIFGSAIVYITAREFGMLGSPEWLLDYPLWTAHYTTASKPATPGNRPWLIWQHRVGAYDPAGPGGHYSAPLQLDQNRISAELPRVTWTVTEPQPSDPNGNEDDDPELAELLARSRLKQSAPPSILPLVNHQPDPNIEAVHEQRDRDITEDEE